MNILALGYLLNVAPILNDNLSNASNFDFFKVLLLALDLSVSE